MRPNQLTVVYDITDEAAFRDGGNPLRYQHDGLKAHTDAAYDAVARCHTFREELERLKSIDAALKGAEDSEISNPDYRLWKSRANTALREMEYVLSRGKRPSTTAP